MELLAKDAALITLLTAVGEAERARPAKISARGHDAFRLASWQEERAG